ncbi:MULTISPECIES: cell division protein ZapE [unclassified Microbacterium]|uniref:cell division protein ZapE n=1 Tax=unclassified Microbacterium TaxID=2609290 RepID=UPI003647A40B
MTALPHAVQDGAHPLTARGRDVGRHLPTEILLDAAQIEAAAALAAPHRHGAYLWGGVGRGKSLLAEAYFAALPTRRKRRVHFHDFFLELQGALGARRVPLDRALNRLIGGSRAILFDEFHVHDVADAVYLTATLRHLVERNVLLIATSNDAPDDLMPGLWHEHFVPAIRIIEQHLDVIEVADGADYRGIVPEMRATAGFSAGSWALAPAREPARAIGVTTESGIGLTVREWSTERITATFDDLCGAPLGTPQYLWLADRTRALLLLDVPDLRTVHREALLRFCHLIDVLYDRDIRLEVRSTASPVRPLDTAVPARSLERALSRISALRRA